MITAAIPPAKSIAPCISHILSVSRSVSGWIPAEDLLSSLKTNNCPKTQTDHAVERHLVRWSV
jgi:hypothetical protein